MTSSSNSSNSSNSALAVDSEDALPSPPLSPISTPELPVVPTDDLGMVADDAAAPSNPKDDPSVKRRRGPVRPRRKVTYVSRHFTREESEAEQNKQRSVSRPRAALSTPILTKNCPPVDQVEEKEDSKPATPPVTPARPRIHHGFNIDDLSSDSSLTDVPDDIGPDPFPPEHATPSSPSKVQAVKVKTPRRPKRSPYFATPHKHRPTFLSTLPFPPLSDERFGLMQERLAHDPFRLLIATIFLNKTPGERAMPIFYDLMSRYPTPADLAHAEVTDITSIIYGLGFQNQRARKCVAMAKRWVADPPERGKRYRKHNYPLKGDGSDVKAEDVLDDGDGRVAWEISHLPGLGPYSHDSWRMFCRDELRGVARSWNGEGAESPERFEPEWKRVLPLDKELRAYLTWMWLKEGWVWNKETGKRTVASEELLSLARGGGIVVEERHSEHLIVKKIDEGGLDSVTEGKRVEQTAGDFLPALVNGGS